MITHIFCLKELFPELHERAVKPIVAIPVFCEGRQVAQTSLNANGEFPIVLPAAIETKLAKGRLSFLPVFEELNRNPDPEKVRLRITGIRVRITPKR